MFESKVSEDYGLGEVIGRLTSDDARKTKTFLFVGAGTAQSDTLAANLRLPLAASVRDRLLTAHYNAGTAEECLAEFIKETKIKDPSPDQVWQFLIRDPTKLRNYAERLHKDFDPDKPIPPSYHMLARWFFTQEIAVGGIATTNFDLQFGAAFQNVAESLNFRQHTDFDIAEVPEDFRYLADCSVQPSKVVQRLHGSLDRPWSIVAGSKENVYKISHHILDYERSHDRKPFDLLRKVLNALDPDAKIDATDLYYPYAYLQKSLQQSATVIVLGYSFQDHELTAAFVRGCAQGKKIYLVDPCPKDLYGRVPNFPRATHIATTADVFLDHFVRSLQAEKQLIQLPFPERQVLRVGPEHVPGHVKARVIPCPHPGESAGFIDPIYGKFQFSPTIENAVLQLVDTGEVQRLRQIKQVSFVNLKYHGATHDRFTHSLGVAHLADVLVSYWRGAGRAAAGLRELEVGDHLAFVAASLIHDIGHGPFGHTMDLVRAKLNDTRGHEEDTERIFKQIFTDKSFADLDLAWNNLEIARNKVDSILGSGAIAPSQTKTDVLHYVLNNSGCDIDRLDFVMRDAASTLMCWNSQQSDVSSRFDDLISNHEKILRAMRLWNGTIAFEASVEPYLRSFAYLYLKLYRDVYYCWQNVAAQAMLAEAVTEMIRSRKVEFADIKPLTDVELLAALEEFENPKVAELAYLVKYRRLFKLIHVADLDETVSIDLSTQDDRTLVEKYVKLNYKDDMLVARLPGKKVRVNLLKLEAEGRCDGELLSDQLLESVVFGSNPPRLMIFEPPR